MKDGPVTSVELTLWYKTPGSSGRTLGQRVAMLANRYKSSDPEGRDSLRSRFNEAAVEAAAKFNMAKSIDPKASRREAFERFLSFVFNATLLDLRSAQSCSKRSGQSIHVDITDPFYDVGQFRDPTERFEFLASELTTQISDDLRAGWLVLINGLRRGDTMSEIVPQIEKVSKIGRTTFFQRLRAVPALAELQAC